MMNRRLALLLGAALMLGGAFGATTEATIDDFSFSPPVLTISPARASPGPTGTTVPIP